MVEKWIITGAEGFIGKNLVNKLFTDYSNTSLTLIDRRKINQVACHMYETYIMDIRKVPSLLFENASYIVHLAAQVDVQKSMFSPLNDAEENVLNTIRVLSKAPLSLKKFIFASSTATYGEVKGPICESSSTNPISPYGISKLAAEKYCEFFCNYHGIPVSILRFTNVYGPHSDKKSSVVNLFVREVVRKHRVNKPGILCINGDGNQTRDYLFVHDAVSAICQAALLPDNYSLFQIGTGISTSVNDLVSLIDKIAYDRYKIRPIVKYNPPKKGEIYHVNVDSSNALCHLTWKASSTLEEGLNKTFDYYEELFYQEFPTEEDSLFLHNSVNTKDEIKFKEKQ